MACNLLRHSLVVHAGFVPERAQRELREVVRYRKSLVEERARERQALRGRISSHQRFMLARRV